MGQVHEKPSGRKNGSSKSKKGISKSNKVKGNGLVHPKVCLELVGGAGGLGIFLFSAMTLRKEEIAVI